MDRQRNIRLLEENPHFVWDILVIGGGASGLGIALDAASRGYKVICIDKHDFAKGTSSRSTKLVHGGVRYLAQGDLFMVMEALEERGIMKRNAPHLVYDQSFIIPNYSWWEVPFYTIGLKIYDLMAGKLKLGASQALSKDEVLSKIPNLKQEGLNGGVIYYDSQFDDARMAISLALTCEDHGGMVLNYMPFIEFIKEGGKIMGAIVKDSLSTETYNISARVVINATGVFADSILKKDSPNAPTTIRPSQGIHLVLDKNFLDGEHSIMIPHTEDGRVLFAVPWHNKVILGTTDTPVDHILDEPVPLESEINFILDTAALYLNKKPHRKDVLSVFAGLRPLAATTDNNSKTKEISRNHKVITSSSGLVSAIGGKWTTYRKIAEDTLNTAIQVAGLPLKKCITKELKIHGYQKGLSKTNHWHVYGCDYKMVLALAEENPEFHNKIHPDLPYSEAEIIWAIRNEMACTVEDVLSRRTRALFLDAKSAIQAAEKIAIIMANELKKDINWIKQQIESFHEISKNYILNPA
jgi:glycerol-3-phosphate dehydrogenase